MDELEKIADQLTRSVEGNAWHGPALLELLNDVNAEQALEKRAGNSHNIWELVNHITLWQKVAVERIDGIKRDVYNDWQNITDTSEAAWLWAIEELKQSYTELRDKILTFSLVKLDEKVLDMDQTYYILFHGMVQHNLYHAGQIAILKKVS